MVIKRTAEAAYVALALLLMSGALDQFVATSTTVEARLSSEANYLLRAFSFPAYIYAVFIFAVRAKGTLRELFRVRWILALLLLSIGSIVWSIDIPVTVPRIMLLLLATAFGWAIACRFDQLSFAKILAAVCLCMVVAQVTSILLVPSLAIHHDIHYPAVRGMFLHKNIAGRTIAMGVVPGLALALTPENRKLGILITAACTVGVIITLSASAILLVLTIFLAYGFFLFYRRQRALGGGVIASLILGIAVLIASGTSGDLVVAFIESLGKDATLSTRTLIWDRLWGEVIADKPILGYGYNAFWSSTAGAVQVWDARYFVPSHAHNGVLQTWVSIGLAGVVVLLFGYFVTAFKAIKVFHQHRRMIDSMFIAFLVFYTITNFSEVSVLSYTGVIWVVFVVMASKIYLAAERSSLPDASK